MIEITKKLKYLVWVGSSKKRLMEFPKQVRKDIGNALLIAQAGVKPPIAKPLKGLGAGVFEIADDYDTNTYRAVYTAKIGKKIYVLHAFQKKSTKGIKTPKKEIDLIKKRLRLAKEREEIR